MRKLLKWLSASNSQAKFLTLSAIVATILFFDPFRHKHSEQVTVLLPPKAQTDVPEQEIKSRNEITSFIPSPAQAHPTSASPGVRRRIAQLLQRVRSQKITEQQEQDIVRITGDAQMMQLMTAADRFMCTTEMATMLAVMHIGGPQRLLYWDDTWDVMSRRAVHKLHSTLKLGCQDDIELALKIYASWSETTFQGQSLVPSWAIHSLWQPYRVPTLPRSLENALGDYVHVNQFKREILRATDLDSLDQLVERYDVKEQAASWLNEAREALRRARQEAWARAYFVNHSQLVSLVEPQRERLLRELSINKKLNEQRPINFDLLKRVRIIFAHYLVRQSSTGPQLPHVIALQPEWTDWLRQSDRTILSLARFIAQQTPRDVSGELIPTYTSQRLFLEQRFPLGSRYIGSVTELRADGGTSIAFGRRIADAAPILETFRGELGPTAYIYSIATNDEQQETIEGALLTAQTTTPPIYRRELARVTGLLPAGPEQQTPSENEIIDTHEIVLAEEQQKQKASQTAKQYTLNDTLVVEVTGYDLADPAHPVVTVAALPERSAFDLFRETYQVGDIITVTVAGYDERPQDNLISLVVREPRTQLELLIDPDHLSFTPLYEAVKEIHIGVQLTVVVEYIDMQRRTALLSLLPLMEVHLERILRELRREDGTYQPTALLSHQHDDTMLLVLKWSDAALGLIYTVEVPRQALPEPQRDYEIGETALLELIFPDTLSSSTFIRLPAEIKQILATPRPGLQRLSWQHEQLHFNGQMAYRTRNMLLTLSNDPVYQAAIHALYHASHRFISEVIAFKPVMLPDEGSETGTVEHIVSTDIIGSMYGLDTIESIEYVRVLEGGESLTENAQDSAEMVGESAVEEDSFYDEEEDKEEQEAPPLPAIMQYQIGQIVDGHVTGVLPYGAFVEVEPGVSGLVHKTKMWGFIEDMNEVLHTGDEVKVSILNINLEQGNLELSMQIPENDPLLKYNIDEKVVGTVTDIQEFGAFVQIEPGVSGLVHKSKMWGYVADVEDVVRIGDEVTVLILNVNMQKRWLELSMQVEEHDPLLKYRPGITVRGVVTDVKDFGAFVEIEPGASGLVHKSDMPGMIVDARRELEVDDEVDVLIVRIDMDRRRMSLSMKDV